MKINSIDRAIRIIELLSENPRGLKLTEISRILDIHPSSIHHIIHTLSPYEYIAQDPDTKKYTLGFRLLEISRRILENIDIRIVARKHLEQLRKKTQETVHLSVLRAGKVVYIDKLDTTGSLSLSTYVGFATDPHAAAGGKTLLADLTDENVKEIYFNRPLKRYGKNTFIKMPMLLEELEKIRKQRYAIDDEEYYEGIRCIAAPIRTGHKTIASISVTGSIFTLTMERIDRELKDLVIKTAEIISNKLR